LHYLHGFGNIISGLEKALEGRFQGDHFSVNIPAPEAYGERDERLIVEMPLENFRGIDNIKPGMQFHIHSSEGVRLITVTKVEGSTVTVDGNHPLAGMNLNFDVTVAAIREASEEETLHGYVHIDGHDAHCGCGDHEGCGGEHKDCGCSRCGH
jgi:FKBP-type peptidyl-prolyl cis-trans isomerase SlyD